MSLTALVEYCVAIFLFMQKSRHLTTELKINFAKELRALKGYWERLLFVR